SKEKEKLDHHIASENVKFAKGTSRVYTKPFGDAFMVKMVVAWKCTQLSSIYKRRKLTESSGLRKSSDVELLLPGSAVKFTSCLRSSSSIFFCRYIYLGRDFISFSEAPSLIVIAYAIVAKIGKQQNSNRKITQAMAMQKIMKNTSKAKKITDNLQFSGKKKGAFLWGNQGREIINMRACVKLQKTYQ
ncbi:hypothetical protein STAS_29361, partial [Striga asiatica]